MRVLLLEDEAAGAAALQRELADRYDVRRCAALPEALALLAQAAWRPDALVAGLGWLREASADSLLALQTAAAGVPVLLRPAPPAGLRRQLDAIASLQASAQGASYSLLRAVLRQPPPAPDLAPPRAELLAEFERLGRDLVEQAVERAVERTGERLGLDDGEGVRLAIRVAKGWEAAKGRFVSALITGIGSAVLLALGTGAMALIRTQTGH